MGRWCKPYPSVSRLCDLIEGKMTKWMTLLGAETSFLKKISNFTALICSEKAPNMPQKWAKNLTKNSPQARQGCFMLGDGRKKQK